MCYTQGLMPKPFDVLGYLSMDINGDGTSKVPWAGIPSLWHMLPVGRELVLFAS